MAVPILDIRDPAARPVIARRLARGEPAAFYMGLFTIMRLIRPPWVPLGDASLFWTVKRGRPDWSKLPLFAKPSHALRLADFSDVHPEFRPLRRREAFERLWSHGAPLHVVVPLRQPLPFLNPSFVTEPTDLTRHAEADAVAADRLIDRPTAAMFWMHDDAWADLATRLQLASPPRSFLGGSSFNDHGADPPFTLAELAVAASHRPELPFEFVIHDALLEECGGFSSHTLVRLPLVSEPPELVVLRRGSVSAEWLQESTQWPVRTLASAPLASRRAGLSDRDLRAAFETLARRRTAGRAA